MIILILTFDYLKLKGILDNKLTEDEYDKIYQTIIARMNKVNFFWIFLMNFLLVTKLKKGNKRVYR
ncbi:MAG: hypothetical protein ACLTDM_00360 [Clostridium butyricum]